MEITRDDILKDMAMTRLAVVLAQLARKRKLLEDMDKYLSHLDRDMTKLSIGYTVSAPSVRLYRA